MRFLLALAVLAAPLTAQTPLPQPTARDTVFNKKFVAEANRPSGPRKTVIKALADSLIRPTPAPPPVPAAPLATFTVACDTTFLCQFDATKSTGYKLSYLWDCGALPNCTPGNTAAFGFRYPHDGSRTAVLTVRDSLARVSSKTDTFVVPKPIPVPPPDTTPPPDTSLKFELPRSVPAPVFGPATRTIAASAGASDLQAIVNAAQPGDSITISGDFPPITLPTKPCGGAGISITGTAPALPVGTRQLPSTKTGRIISTTSEPAIRFASLTCQWRLDGFEVVGSSPGTVVNYGMVSVGGTGDQGQTSLDKVPRNIVLSHLYVHGLGTTNSTRCVVLQSAETVVRDSYIDDCHAKGMDSQAIEGWNGPGPFLIENNYLAGAGENVMFGGAAPAIFGLIPSDITIRRSHFIKLRQWQGVWTIKNHLEFKAASRVLVEQNVFQDIWPSGQEGFSVVVKSNQGDETNPVSLPYGTSNVTIQGNLIDSAAIAIDVHGSDCYPTCPTITTNRVVIRGNLSRNIGLPNEGRAAGMLITKNPRDVVVVGNSFYHHPSVTNTRGSAITLDRGNNPPALRLSFQNNYFEGGAYQVFHSGGKIGSAALDSMSGPGNWTFSGNALLYGTASRYPAGNTFPTTSTLTPGVGANI